MPTLGDRIKRARHERQMSQSELAGLLGVGRSVISNWEHNVNQPLGDKLIHLCQALDLSAAYVLDYYGGETSALAGEDEETLHKLHKLDSLGQHIVSMVLNLEYKRCLANERNRTKKSARRTRPIRFVPLPVSAGYGARLEEEPCEAIDIPLTPESREADFVLHVVGDSMEPEFHDGQLLLVQQTEVVPPGELGVFAVNGEGYFKRCGIGQLESLNPAYSPIPLNEWDKVRTFGRVIGVTERVSEES